MKKILLLWIILLAVEKAYPQSERLTKPSGVMPMTPKKLDFNENTAGKSTTTVFTGPVKKSADAVNGNAKVASIKMFTGSHNVFGYLLSQQKPLQYNAGVNAVSFVMRKSPQYVATPNSNSGSIVGFYSTNMGTTWDSTCIYTDAANFGRYPQGGIYNPLGNTNINNAYLVGSGPAVASAWVGCWYASKPITTPGTTTPGPDQQVHLWASATIKKHVMSRHAFTAIDGGLVRSMAAVVNDPVATTNSAYGLRGAAMVKGQFNACAFIWSVDSFIPACTMNSNGTPATTDDYKNLSGTPLQAWNENGTIGYVIMLGSRASETISATRVNAKGGYQPIVYKTTNSGASWVLLPSQDFANPFCFKGVYDRTYPVNTNSTLIVPNFSGSEGFDAVVDANNDLHLTSMVYGHTSNHVDSLGYRNVFGTEQYSYGETGPFNYPIIYDFYTIGCGWKYFMVDSMGTEGPTGTAGQPGFGSNQWSDGSGAKMDQDARLQMSRSVDGTKLFYTWSESDTIVTGNKWNTIPDIKLKGYDVVSKNMTARMDLTTADPGHSGLAYYHYTSNKAAVSAGCYTIPTTLTRNITLDGSLAVQTYFNNNGVLCSSNFAVPALSPGFCPPCAGINEQNTNSYEVLSFPNPANDATTIIVGLKEASSFEVVIYNSIGQMVEMYKLNGKVGSNEIHVDLSNSKAGIYFYNVKVGNSVVTKKLIVQ